MEINVKEVKYDYGKFKINVPSSGSHTEGDGTLALNDYEHAEGTYNVSNTGTASQTTRHSIGIGGNSSNRKNAFEVMQNGDIYAYGVGGYDGTNAGQNGINTLQDSLVKIWRGTQVHYDALSPNYDDNTIYIIS